MLKKRSIETLTCEIEQELMPGQFVRYDDMFDFTRHLSLVEGKLEEMVDEGDAAQAIPLYEIFLAGCYEKMDECDDSGADLSMFWVELFCGWIKARQAAGRPAEETVQQILKWEENDDYGLCFEIEKDVVKVLNREGYRFFVRHFEQVVDEGLAALKGPRPQVIFEYDNSIRLPARSLKGIYQAKGDVKSYAALCEQLGLSPKDCERLAEIEMSKRHWDRALTWVEKGLALTPIRNWRNESSSSLKHRKPKILSKLGRKEDALAMAWNDFEKSPSDFTYNDFMQYVPKEQRAQWHERAMEIATRCDLREFMDICVKTKEWSRLAARVHSTPHAELEDVSHYYLEAAADGLTKRDLPAAAKLYRALGSRILISKKSKYYDAALSHFRCARDLYRKAGLESEWDAVVDTIRVEHSRKYSFMPGFEEIVEGKERSRPAFADRARARWAKQTGAETE